MGSYFGATLLGFGSQGFQEEQLKDLPTIANICMSDGPYYRVRLEWLPRVGDFISLFSFADQASNDPNTHSFEVVRVVHDLYDVTESFPEGKHFVSIHVKASNFR